MKFSKEFFNGIVVGIAIVVFIQLLWGLMAYKFNKETPISKLSTPTGLPRQSNNLECDLAAPKIEIDPITDKKTFVKDSFGYPFYKNKISGVTDKNVEIETCAEYMSDVPIIRFRGIGYELQISPLHFNPEIPYYTSTEIGTMKNGGKVFRLQTLYDAQQMLNNNQFVYYYAFPYQKVKNGMCEFVKGSVRMPCGETYLTLDSEEEKKTYYVIKCTAEAEDLAKGCDEIVKNVSIIR